MRQRTEVTRELNAFQTLRDLSARVGADPLLVQGAGGNTSIKQDKTLWIKASGTWLMNALRHDVFVPVDLPRLLAALANHDPAAVNALAFVREELNPTRLRPSIETTVHALMPQRVVVHVHCVETIALAVRADADQAVASRLGGIDWVIVPYCQPGLPLARSIAARRGRKTDVLVLGNHGLVVAAETVAEAEALLGRVRKLLAATPRTAPACDASALAGLAADSGYRLPASAEAHAAATDPASCRIAAAGTLYPDHLVFLGKGSVVARPGESAADIAREAKANGRSPPMEILFPGKGVLLWHEANAGAEAMARCLADVTARIDPDAPLRFLTDEEANSIVNWDAEKYRQELTRRMTAP